MVEMPVGVDRKVNTATTEIMNRILQLGNHFGKLAVNHEHALFADRHHDISAGAKQDMQPRGDCFVTHLGCTKVSTEACQDFLEARAFVCLCRHVHYCHYQDCSELLQSCSPVCMHANRIIPALCFECRIRQSLKA